MMLKTLLLIVYAVLFVFGAFHTACMLIDYAESDEYEKCYNPLREIAFLIYMSVVMLSWPFIFTGSCIYCVMKKVVNFI